MGYETWYLCSTCFKIQRILQVTFHLTPRAPWSTQCTINRAPHSEPFTISYLRIGESSGILRKCINPWCYYLIIVHVRIHPLKRSVHSWYMWEISIHHYILLNIHTMLSPGNSVSHPTNHEISSGKV